MLGELYVPSGPALETAVAVLETEKVRACNVGFGCPNGCAFCYGPLATRQSRENWLNLRLPKESPKALVQRQMVNDEPLRCLATQGFFLSFLTDPFLPQNIANTNELVGFLLSGLNHHVLATLSKLGISEMDYSSLRSGLSVVSLDEDFRKTFEPRTLPLKERLKLLCIAHERGYSWVSIEPYPCSDIWKQSLEPLLEELKFWGVDFIIFGKWNYDARANTEKARIEYAEDIHILTDFCKSNKVRFHVKSKTVAFAFPERLKENAL